MMKIAALHFTKRGEDVEVRVTLEGSTPIAGSLYMSHRAAVLAFGELVEALDVQNQPKEVQT